MWACGEINYLEVFVMAAYLILLPFNVYCGCISAKVADEKNRAWLLWFLAGLLFGPFSWGVALLPKNPKD